MDRVQNYRFKKCVIPPQKKIVVKFCRIWGSHSGSYKIAIFWDIAPCGPFMNRCFGGTYHLVLQDRKSAEQETGGWHLTSHPLQHWFLAPLTFCPEDGGDMFFRKIGSHTDHTALHPRIWQHSFVKLCLLRGLFYAAYQTTNQIQF
jgi:hypothetical protein